VCPQVARQLWQLVVVDSQLLKPLQAMRDYFLLGRGDLYQYFIHDCYERNVTQMRPGNNTEKELNVLYRSAAAKCGVEDDADFGRLRVRALATRALTAWPCTPVPVQC
jgi:gamma-tubulin complex component 4